MNRGHKPEVVAERVRAYAKREKNQEISCTYFYAPPFASVVGGLPHTWGVVENLAFGRSNPHQGAENQVV